MSFAYQHHRASPRKQFRLDRMALRGQFNDEELARLKRRLDPASQLTMTILVSAAILWFHSLDRDDQLTFVLAETGQLKRDPLSIQVVAWIGDIFVNLRFPMHPMHTVLRAATLGFAGINAEHRNAWIREVYIGPVGEGA